MANKKVPATINGSLDTSEEEVERGLISLTARLPVFKSWKLGARACARRLYLRDRIQHGHVSSIATNHVCPKAGNLSSIMIKSGQSVTITPGCHIPTMDYLITTDETNDMEIVTSWLDWTMTLSQLFNHHDSEELAAMITNISHLLQQTL